MVLNTVRSWFKNSGRSSRSSLIPALATRERKSSPGSVRASTMDVICSRDSGSSSAVAYPSAWGASPERHEQTIRATFVSRWRRTRDWSSLVRSTWSAISSSPSTNKKHDVRSSNSAANCKARASLSFRSLRSCVGSRPSLRMTSVARSVLVHAISLHTRTTGIDRSRLPVETVVSSKRPSVRRLRVVVFPDPGSPRTRKLSPLVARSRSSRVTGSPFAPRKRLDTDAKRSGTDALAVSTGPAMPWTWISEAQRRASCTSSDRARSSTRSRMRRIWSSIARRCFSSLGFPR